MDAATRSYFATLISSAQNALDSADVVQLNLTPDRAILEIHGVLGQFDIRLKEIVKLAERMYSYYVLSAGEVVGAATGHSCLRAGPIAASLSPARASAKGSLDLPGFRAAYLEGLLVSTTAAPRNIPATTGDKSALRSDPPAFRSNWRGRPGSTPGRGEWGGVASWGWSAPGSA